MTAIFQGSWGSDSLDTLREARNRRGSSLADTSLAQTVRAVSREEKNHGLFRVHVRGERGGGAQLVGVGFPRGFRGVAYCVVADAAVLPAFLFEPN